MDYATCRSLPAMFFETAARRGDRPFLWAKRDRVYRPLSWSEAAEQVRRLAGGLLSLGIEPCDRVALVAESRPEWAVADLAIMSIGAVTVPAYTTNTVEDHRYVLGNSGARVAIVSTPPLAASLIPAAEQVPSVGAVVAIEPPGVASVSSLDVHSWDSLLADTTSTVEDDVLTRLAALSPDDTACLIYTSGTGGVPKGVMLRHPRQLPRRLSPVGTARPW
jgi:long-chain acyl-CoA synthetase